MASSDYISRIDVPKHYPFSLRTVDEWIANRTVPVIRMGRKVVFRASDIESFLDRHVDSVKKKPGRPTKADQVAKRQAAAK